jgi:glycosyltransferase involved in cell wall biosynthesis
LKPSILCSSCIITYNQQEFIQQCLSSLVSQSDSFSHEIIVGDDSSTDKTLQVIQSFRDEHCSQVNYFTNSTNQGVASNFLSTIQKSSGKYVAIVEGDDYWIDPNKLQKQIDVLEANDNLSFCFTDVKVEKEGKIVSTHPNLGRARSFEGIELADQPGSIAQTCSLVIRRALLDDIPDWVLRSYTLDWCLQLFLSKFGPAYYLPESMAVYRIHDNGIWSKLNEFDAWRKNLCFYRTALGQFSLTDHKKRLRKRIITTIKDALELANVTADKKEIRYWLKERLAVSPVDRFRQTIQSLLLLAKLRKAT